MRLDEHPPRLRAAPGPPRDLGDLLKTALRRAKVSALQAKVSINHAHQRQIGEVIALRHQLRADDDINIARLHPPDEFGGLRRRPERVRRDDRAPRFGKQQRNLIGDALNTGAAGDQRILLMTFGASARRRHRVAAVMALQPLDQAVFNHPRGAIGALKTVAAVAAERERGKTAPIEEEQALFALRKRFAHCGNERRCQPSPAFGRILRQVERDNLRHFGHAVTPRQLEFAVTAKRHLLARFNRGCCCRKHNRHAFKARAHYRDIARVIANALFLLKAGFVRLINDDQPQIAVG